MSDPNRPVREEVPPADVYRNPQLPEETEQFTADAESMDVEDDKVESVT